MILVFEKYPISLNVPYRWETNESVALYSPVYDDSEFCAGVFSLGLNKSRRDAQFLWKSKMFEIEKSLLLGISQKHWICIAHEWFPLLSWDLLARISLRHEICTIDFNFCLVLDQLCENMFQAVVLSLLLSSLSSWSLKRFISKPE